jgi:hypothetical protein
MKNIFKDLKRRDHKRYLGGLDVFKYIGPGLLVTVGFIDPGNWASNFAAGSEFGYSLLWVVTLSTIMLIVLQHNVAHPRIVTGLCLSEAATNISASEVEMEASTAVPNMGRDTQEGVYLVAASDKHKPVTMPRCATLCCNTISMIVDKVTTHSNE